METKLKRIAFLSIRDKNKQFSSLMHLFNEESLKECFDSLDGRKAVGADGIDKDNYAASLDKNIKQLVERMKRMSYWPGPMRQTPKEGKIGAVRPLGIEGFGRRGMIVLY